MSQSNHPPKPIDALLTCASESGALLAAGAALGYPRKPSTPHTQEYVLVPEGYRCEPIEPRYAPDYPDTCAKLRDAASFVKYFNDHSTADSRIYAQLEPACFLAVLDDHASAKEDDELAAEDQARFRSYRAQFLVPASKEWLTWRSADKRKFSQLEFAEFLQDNLPDIDGDGAALLELALRFEANTNSTFVAHQRLQDGSHNLQWRVEGAGNDSAKLPEHITLRIPVFENTAPVEQPARLRYRAKEGTLTLWFELVRPHKTLEAAFSATWLQIEQGTSQQLLLGSPE